MPLIRHPAPRPEPRRATPLLPKIPHGVSGSRRRRCGWRPLVAIAVGGGPPSPSLWVEARRRHPPSTLTPPAELRIELRREIRPQHAPAAGHGTPVEPLDRPCVRRTRRRGGPWCSGTSRQRYLSDLGPFILACRKWSRERSRAAAAPAARDGGGEK
jgi:hypothetical protein